MNFDAVRNKWVEFVKKEILGSSEIRTDDFRVLAKILNYNEKYEDKNCPAEALRIRNFFLGKKRIVYWINTFEETPTKGPSPIRSILDSIVVLSNKWAHDRPYLNNAIVELMIAFIRLCDLVSEEIREKYVREIEIEKNAPSHSGVKISETEFVLTDAEKERQKEFKQFLESIGHTAAVINSYKSALNKIMKTFKFRIWDVANYADFMKEINAIISDERFEVINKNMHGSCNAAAEKYKEFLKEKGQNDSLP